MLPFFPNLYPEELIYGGVGRYHYYSGNITANKTTKETLGPQKVLCSIEVTSGMDYFASQYGFYNSDYFINNHSLLPLFLPFLSQKRQKEVIELTKGHGTSLYSKLGLNAIQLKPGISYCPLCVVEDISKFREPYIHRIHQMPNLLVCPSHSCLLEEYIIKNKNRNRARLVKLQPEHLSLSPRFEQDLDVATKLTSVAKSAEYFFNYNVGSNVDDIKHRYYYFLKERNFLVDNQYIKKQYLLKEFICFYGLPFLEKLNCEYNTVYNWFSRYLLNTPNPISHILLILFLAGSIENFFNTKTLGREMDLTKPVKTISDKPFGIGPWACLNPVANHYKQEIIKDCLIHYHKGIPIGTFKCQCGYSYFRKGPDKLAEDKFRKDKVQCYGEVWEGKLRELVIENKIKKPKQLAKIMGCWENTIFTYAHKLGIHDEIEGKFDDKYKLKNKNPDILETRKVVEDYITNNPSATRSQIRQEKSSECQHLHKHDNEWLLSILPPPVKPGHLKESHWKQKDKENCIIISKVYKELIDSPKTIWITKNLLLKEAFGCVRKINPEKLPKTFNLLNKLSETLDESRIRRINFVVENMKQEGIELSKKKVLREANLREDIVDITPRVEEYLNQILKNLE